MTAYQGFVEAFQLELVELMANAMTEPWTEETPDLFRERLREAAREQAVAFGVGRVAGECVAHYALMILTIDGIPLHEATPERLAASSARGARADAPDRSGG